MLCSGGIIIIISNRKKRDEKEEEDEGEMEIAVIKFAHNFYGYTLVVVAMIMPVALWKRQFKYLENGGRKKKKLFSSSTNDISRFHSSLCGKY